MTNKNDTIRGLVKYANAAPYRRLQKIKFKENEDAKVKIFPPEENKAFGAGDKVFHSCRSDGARYFMELIIDGPLKLYEYSETKLGVPQNGGSADVSNYYLLREGAYDVFAVSGSFKKLIAEYLSDNEEIANKIKEGVYKRRDIQEIVQEYNRAKQKD
ncbi:MAG TPA: hypothetical protein VGD65_06955 [Chryseosolibacter sp.]